MKATDSCSGSRVESAWTGILCLVIPSGLSSFFPSYLVMWFRLCVPVWQECSQHRVLSRFSSLVKEVVLCAWR